jgi:hypothetical protein
MPITYVCGVLKQLSDIVEFNIYVTAIILSLSNIQF